MLKVTKNLSKANAITHGGSFHCDDVMATVILKKVYGNLTVCRVPKMPSKFPKDAIIYDIGGGEFDHHQKGGNGVRQNGIPYASCGLIWKKFGEEYLKKEVSETYVNILWKRIDQEIMAGIDALDNGAFPEINYPTWPLSITSIINNFNPVWESKEDPDDAFLKAVNLAETIFDNFLLNAKGKLKARSIISEKIANSKFGIMILDKYVPWQDAIFYSKDPKASQIMFVVYPSNRDGYCWQCVPTAPGSHSSRKDVPKEWRGLQNEDLRRVTGVSSATFCHKDGFIGGAENMADAIEIAKLAMRM